MNIKIKITNLEIQCTVKNTQTGKKYIQCCLLKPKLILGAKSILACQKTYNIRKMQKRYLNWEK